jgi:hypothetical protein
MRSMEELHIRVHNDRRQPVVHALTHDCNKTGTIHGLKEIRVYIDAVIDTDFRIQFYWKIPVSGQGSDIAHAFVNGIKTTGSVKHTVWHEYPAR